MSYRIPLNRPAAPAIAPLARFRDFLARFEPVSPACYVLLAVAMCAALNLYPLRQASETGGYLCYQNAFDESTYLQYDFSRSHQSLQRIGQYLVTSLHEAGLSSGWINLTFDVVAFVLFVVLVRGTLRRLGFDAGSANIGSLAAVLLPALFLGANPAVHRLFQYILKSGDIYWITCPEAWYLPLQRSPEPQVSLLLATFAIYLSVRRRSFVPCYLFLPFLYPFVAIPFAFCLFALHLHCRFKAVRPWVAALLSYLLIAGLLFLLMTFVITGPRRDFFTHSHEPLLSFCGVVTIVLYATLRKLLREDLRPLGLVLAIAPWVNVNQQLLSGYFTLPNAYEQTFGGIAAALIIILAALPYLGRRALQWATLVGLTLLTYDYACTNYDIQAAMLKGIPLTPELITTLKDDSPNVAISDPTLASFASMLFPKQPLTSLAHQQTFKGMADKAFDHYVWVKSELRKRPDVSRHFEAVFKQLDASFRYEGDDFILLHVGRRRNFIQRHDPEQPARDLGFAPLKIMVIERPK